MPKTPEFLSVVLNQLEEVEYLRVRADQAPMAPEHRLLWYLATEIVRRDATRKLRVYQGVREP